MPLGKSRGQILIGPVRMLGQSGNDTQVVDVSGGESKVQFYKEQYCIGTWSQTS